MTTVVKLRDDQIQFIEAALIYINQCCDGEMATTTIFKKFTAERTKERSEEILDMIGGLV